MELIRELTALLESQENTDELSEKLAYKRGTKKNVVRVIRCTAGKRKGKRVPKISDCFKRKNFKLARAARKNVRKTRVQRLRSGKKTRRTALFKVVKKLNKNLSRK